MTATWGTIFQPPGDGPQQFSSLGLLSNFFINQRPAGQSLVAGDDTTGNIGSFPNPVWTGKRPMNAEILTERDGESVFTSAGYRNEVRWQRDQVLNYDTNPMITGEQRTWTPIPLPNTLPIVTTRLGRQ